MEGEGREVPEGGGRGKGGTGRVPGRIKVRKERLSLSKMFHSSDIRPIDFRELEAELEAQLEQAEAKLKEYR